VEGRDTIEERASAEQSYRRGYQQGAYRLMEALGLRGIDTPQDLAHWVNITLYDWRYGPTKNNRDVHPPDPPKIK
jgi:hypothetical protein